MPVSTQTRPKTSDQPMTLLDPSERTRTGVQHQTTLLGLDAPEPAPQTLFQSSWRDYLFAEIWGRPGLDRRSRYFITISSAACEGGRAEILEGYVRGALKLGDITVAELREAALQLAVYAGWCRGEALDMAVTRVAKQLDLPTAGYRPLRKQSWDPQKRIVEGSANFATVMKFPSPPPTTAYFGAGIVNFVFGEMWMRPELDQRARRWVTLVGVAYSSAATPIRRQSAVPRMQSQSDNATPTRSNVRRA